MRCVEFFNTLKEARQFMASINWKDASIKITREIISEENNKVMFAVWYDAPNMIKNFC